MFHCVLTGKITETTFDDNYAEECNHLQDKWELTYVFLVSLNHILPPLLLTHHNWDTAVALLM